MQKRTARRSPRAHISRLSDREMQVMRLLADGCIYKEIAECLSVSIDTVRMHIKSIYRKYRVTSKAGAVAKHMAGTRVRRATS